MVETVKPIVFKERTGTLGRPVGITEEQCGSLSVHQTGEQVISCWRASWRERLSLLVFGRVWLWVWSGNTQPPVTLEATRTVFSSRRPWWRRLFGG